MKDETVQAFDTMDAEQQAADEYAKSKGAKSLQVMIAIRRDFLAGVQWQKQHLLKSEALGRHHSTGSHGSEL